MLLTQTAGLQIERHQPHVRFEEDNDEKPHLRFHFRGWPFINGIVI